MTDPSGQTTFVYTTYIKATPERVWQGLTEPALTKRYWRHPMAGGKTLRSDWKKGSTWDLVHEDVGIVVSDPEQVILESDPCRRLAYTWHTFTPEWAAHVGMDAATATRWRAEPRSKATFDIEDVGHGATKLTVTHDGFISGSSVLPAISEGWPAVLSSLKTLLETERRCRPRRAHKSRAPPLHQSHTSHSTDKDRRARGAWTTTRHSRTDALMAIPKCRSETVSNASHSRRQGMPLRTPFVVSSRRVRAVVANEKWSADDDPHRIGKSSERQGDAEDCGERHRRDQPCCPVASGKMLLRA